MPFGITRIPAIWSLCSCVIRIASSPLGSSPEARKRRVSSRQESPASTNRRVVALEINALLPWLPLASTVTEAPIGRAYPQQPVDYSSFLESGLREERRGRSLCCAGAPPPLGPQGP